VAAQLEGVGGDAEEWKRRPARGRDRDGGEREVELERARAEEEPAMEQRAAQLRLAGDHGRQLAEPGALLQVLERLASERRAMTESLGAERGARPGAASASAEGGVGPGAERFAAGVEPAYLV
jgi:hypothetical protein